MTDKKTGTLLHAPAVSLSHPTRRINATIQLPSSKSESNRVLIMEALCQKSCQLTNLSEARDTVTMRRLLDSTDLELDVIDAGTTMRFLAAYCAVTNRQAILTGTERMCERPIALLVEALRELGAEIDYLDKEGFPPIHIKDFVPAKKYVAIRGDISSQYISALLMIAPVLPQGLILELQGEIGSRPYIQMTLNLMKHFGIDYAWHGNTITVENQTYQPAIYSVESDWSAASYWYSMVTLAEEAEITLLGLRQGSLQGDSIIVDIMDLLGVQTQFVAGDVILTKKSSVKSFEYDFTDCPDLAQTIAVLAAAKGIEIRLTGLQSLRVKETDRIVALKDELEKFGIKTFITRDAEMFIPSQHIRISQEVIYTYKDHRMAMAFAPLALLFDEIEIDSPGVVAKSYPRFWDDLLKGGFIFR